MRSFSTRSLLFIGSALAVVLVAMVLPVLFGTSFAQPLDETGLDSLGLSTTADDAADEAEPGQLNSELLEGLRLLRTGQLRPENRTRWVERFSDPSLALNARHLAPLFEIGAESLAQIDGARIAVARRDPQLIPLMFEAFLNSKMSRSTFDPDIFERLLRGLQSFSKAELRELLVEMDLSFVALASRQRLDFDWLEPLGVGEEDELSVLQPSQRRAAEQTARVWLEELLAGDHGLTPLQTDSGDKAFQLFRRLEAQHLAVMLRDGSEEDARLALEVAVQRQLLSPELKEALRVRLEKQPFAGMAAQAARLQEPGLNRVHLYPVVALEEQLADREWLLSIAREGAVEPLVLVSAAVILAFLLPLLAARLVRRWEQLWFRLAALSLAPLLLLSIELVLAACAYQPAMELGPTFNPNRAPPQLLTERVLEGEPYVVNLPGNSRQLVHRRDKPAGSLRVVTLGESSVHGTHYLNEESFSSVLERRLAGSFGAGEVEVINLGVGGALSDEIVHYARQSYVLDPDLLILYFGNNDLADIYRLAGFRAYSAGGVALRFVLARLRVARLLSSLLPDWALGRVDAEGGWLDSEGLSFEESSFLRRVAELNLRSNMERLVRDARRQGVDSLLVLQAQNDDMCGPTNEQDDSFHSGCFQQALRRVAYQVAARTGVPVVDMPQALRSHRGMSPDQGQWEGEIFQPRREGAGHELFYDTCHPTRLGHQLIGEFIAPTAVRVLRLRQ